MRRSSASRSASARRDRRAAGRGGTPPGGLRHWLRRALPWLPAAAFAVGSVPAATAQIIVPPNINQTTESTVVDDYFVNQNGSVTVAGAAAWLKAQDFITGNFVAGAPTVTISGGGTLTTQAGSTLVTPPYTGTGRYFTQGGTTTVTGADSLLFVGLPAGSLATGDVTTDTEPALTAAATGTLLIDGEGTLVTALAGGDIVAGDVSLINGGDLTVSGANAALDVNNGGGGGLISVDGLGSLLRADTTGDLFATTLSLTNGGNATVSGAGSVITFVTGTVSGPGSLLQADTGADVTGTTFTTANGGNATVSGAGSTFTFTTATLGGGTLLVNDTAALTATNLNISGGALQLQALSTGTFANFALNGGSALVDNSTVTVNGGPATLTAGTLTVQSGGQFALNGGSTLNVAGGVAAVDGATSLIDANAATTVNGGSIVARNAGQFTGTTLTANGGRVLVTDTGQFALTGAASFNGAGAALQVASDGDFTTASSLSLGGGASGVISGTGSTATVVGATTLGGGSLLAQADGDYVGGGGLNVGGGGSVGASGAGSTVTTVGAASNGGGTFFAENGGVVSVASLTQSSGLLNPRAGGAINSAGLVAVNGGEARIDGTLNAPAGLLMSGGTLSGAGRVNGDTLLAGALSAGADGGASIGVLTVDGDFASTPAATYNLQVRPVSGAVPGTDFDRLNVTGDATVGGGTVNVIPVFVSGQRFAVGQQFAFLSAGGTLTEAAPATIVDPFLSTEFATQVIGNDYVLVVTSSFTFQDFGNTFNAQQVGGALDGVVEDPALNNLLFRLDTLPSQDALARVLNSLSGEVYGSQLTAFNRSSLQFLDRIDGRDAADPLACGHCGGRPSFGLTGWQQTYGTEGRVNGDGNAFGVETNASGLIVGLEQAFDAGPACVTLGAFFGSEMLSTEVPNANSEVNDRVNRVGGTARVTLGRAYARATAFGGSASGESRRAVRVTDAALPFVDLMTAETETGVGAFSLEGGYLFGVPQAYVMPIAGLRYVRADRDAFTESGGQSALSVRSDEQEETRLRFGARAGREVLVAGLAPATFTLEGVYSRDLDDGTVGGYDAQFNAAPAARFSARGTDFGKDRFVVSPGLSVGLGPVQLAGQYYLDLTDTSVLHSGDVRLQVCF